MRETRSLQSSCKQIEQRKIGLKEEFAVNCGFMGFLKSATAAMYFISVKGRKSAGIVGAATGQKEA